MRRLPHDSRSPRRLSSGAVRLTDRPDGLVDKRKR